MQFAVRAADPLRHVYRALCLAALLIAGQQGAVVHALGHLAGTQSTAPQAGAGETSDGNCALCPLFAQAATAACSHTLPVPLPRRAAIDRASEPPVEAIDGTIPTPRSRGPPSLS